MRVAVERAPYGIITEETIEEIFSRRILTAALLMRADKDTAFMASMVYSTLVSVRNELRETIQ